MLMFTLAPTLRSFFARRLWRDALALVVLCALPMAAPAAQLTAVDAQQSEGRTVVDLAFDDAPSWNWFRLNGPPRLVLDLPATTTQLGALEFSKGWVERVRFGVRGDALRVVLDLRQNAPQVDVARVGRALRVTLSEDAPATSSAAKPQLVLKARPIIVVIDAGHGGKDPGAIGPTGLQEKHVALSIAREIQRLLHERPNYEAKLTRDTDVFLSLRTRMQFARKSNADMFVSIHADAFDDPRAKGSSVYILSNRGASSEYARLLANRENASDLVGGVNYNVKDDMLASVLLDISMSASIEASSDIAQRVLGGLAALGPLHKKTVQGAGFVVLKSPDVPSILVETAFISNPREEKNLGSRAHRQKIAQAVVNGIELYFKEYRPAHLVMADRPESG